MEYLLTEKDETFTFKNENTKISFVRINEIREVEYIFVNPIFRKKGLAKKLLKLVKKKLVKSLFYKILLAPWLRN